MKKMLINARQAEETRIAIVDNNQLLDLDIESVDREQKKANIYKAKISRIEPSLNAVFVNYGEDKNGFLPYKEISPEYFKKTTKDPNTPLNELLDVGQELIVQIAKEERGTKGAALSTFITLAGCYMVLMPNNPSAGGISRRIEGDERQKLKTLFDSLTIPNNMGVIIRTAGVDRSAEEIQADLDTLINLWDAIKRVSYQRKAPFLIHKESDITIRAIRDHLKEDINEIIIDDEEAFEDLKRQLSMLRPHFISRLQLYKKELSLFNAFQIEKQIESAFKREVHLPSGGSIVIDTTEALTAIDINSARATKGDNIEETALATNLEAAEEIARQLRLRDLGGLIVVDFIDMAFFPNQKAVEQKLVDALYSDRAKIQMTRISKFGLVEISRQRLQASLGESVMHACPRCEGHGFIRSIPSLALSILRNVHAEALREKTNELRVQLPIDVATFLLNEKRDELSQIEEGTNTKVLLIPNANLQSPHYNIQRIWGEAYTTNRPSYNLIEEEQNVQLYKTPKHDKSKQPALKSVNQTLNSDELDKANNKSNQKLNRQVPQKQIDKHEKNQKNQVQKNLLVKLMSFFFSEKQNEKEKSNHKHINKENSNKDQCNEQRNDRNIRDNNDRGNKQNRQQQSDKSDNVAIKQKREQNSQQSNERDRNANKLNGRNNRPNQRLQVHQSEEVINISILKKESPEAIKAAKEKAMMKTISTTPEEKISLMVRKVLTEANTLSSGKATQIETHSAHTNKTKYLTFEVINITELAKEEVLKGQVPSEDDVIVVEHDNEGTDDEVFDVIVDEATIQSSDADNNMKESDNSEEQKIKKPKVQDKKARPRKNTRKALFIEYSAAVDVNSQGFISKELQQ
ncbi:Rne/Rng family ribonuclease [Fastidiosibacter lacustris]|uniref:Rne/Rng family ribonuclease n=1 Tax=Fastidiosibacter lacustris TaxID=2056695 RepID=UPI000E3546C4|nr:Rne/Rng family ribonuclease [Fastidiosibacter lacustris]